MRFEPASLNAPPGLGEFLTELGHGEGGFQGTSFGRGEADLETFLRACCNAEDPNKLAPGFVPMTTYWMIGPGEAVVGMLRVRHKLTDRLLQNGGHIGYYVRPAERRKGYAGEALRFALDRLRQMGVPRALITVDPANAASIRTALSAGGQLDGQGVDPDTGRRVNRYWIDLRGGRVDPARDCVFCKILAGQLPSWRVYEDDDAVALLAKGHITRGHTLVIPRRHAADLWSLTEAEAAATMRAVHRVAALLRQRLPLVGLNVTQANGQSAWQEVFHYHVHLIPRYGDDGFQPPWRTTSPSDDQFDAIRRQIVGTE